MSKPILPAEVYDLIESLAESRLSAEEKAKANHALTKYKRETPKTLADYGEGVRTEIVYYDGGGHWFQSKDPDGVMVDGKLVPWPSTEDTVDLEPLLKNGWQRRELKDVPEGWELAAGRTDDGDHGSYYFTYREDRFAAIQRTPVWCRPPKASNVE